MVERRLAFCVSDWASDTTLYSWSYTKQYILRVSSDDSICSSGFPLLLPAPDLSALQKVKDEAGKETLSPLDKLFIVHVNAGRRSKGWAAGGPLLPNLELALASYPHTIEELEGNNVASAVAEFAERAGISVIILGAPCSAYCVWRQRRVEVIN
jgi:hypothetical protein